MSLCNFRTFTFILVLELAAFESQVEGFTIQRTLEVPSDPVTAESTHLEVRNDLRRNVKPIETTNDSPPLTVPINTTAKTEEIQKNGTQPISTNTPDADTNSTTVPVTTTNQTASNSSVTSILSKPTTASYNASVSASTIASPLDVVPSSPTSTETESDERTKSENRNDTTTNVTIVKNNENSVNSSNQMKTIENVNSTNQVNTIKKTAYQVNATNQLNTTEKLNVTKQVNITKELNTNNQVNTTNQLNATSQVSINSTKQMNSSNLVNITKQVNTTDQVNITNQQASINASSVNATTWQHLIKNNTSTNEVNWKTEESNMASYSTETVELNDTAAIDTFNSIDDSHNVTVASNESLPTTLSDKEDEQKNITEESKKSTEALSGNTSSVAIPYWKKYTTIDRKRVNTTKDSATTTETDQDLLQSGTAQTQTSISLEKALNIISDIPSLEQLKNDLLALNKMSSSTESLEKVETQNNDVTIPATSPDNTTVKTSDNTTLSSDADAPKFSIVSTKRAGFLDFSSRPANGTEIPVVEEVVNMTDVPWNYSTTVTTTTAKPKTTPQTLLETKSMTSQSQLAEDAINEELMKEEILNDNVENAQRSRDDRFGVKTKALSNVQPSPSTKPDTSSEDKLRVKPISTEKLKTTLYAVSPNYKPLKKIEVQPPKPFMRNPDDNSWRNESLSSLGIVFKANNSSKPFTQVLKNKTETEWNTLLEKYSKGGETELRTRLEKIAEMRKTKKKKINSLGETVYTDYEESTSAESANSTNSAETGKNITSFLDKAELNRVLPTRVYTPNDSEITTKKAQKLLDEYEDDDDEDYTLPNIDLKKYFTPTVAAPALPPSQFTGTVTSVKVPETVRTYAPDRQPTVQYFPPREKQQKVVINDYDTVFQQKINAYTFDTPRKVTSPVPQTSTPPPQVTFNYPKIKFEQQNRPNDIVRRPDQMNRNIYLTQPAQDQSNTNAFNNQPPQDVAGYNQASYVIKHLRDFIDEVVKADELPVTEEPLRGVTVNNVQQARDPPKPPKDYYDYEAQFRKDVLSRFVDNFNQNSERFKADFPVLYNTSVVHSQPNIGVGGAESTVFMKRLYDDVRAFQHNRDVPKRYDPHCDRTVELSPAYELHYYIPEEEEKEEVEVKPISTPHHHRLRI